MKKTTQAMQVIEAMRKEGGYATLRRLNEVVDFSTWATKTPEATVRRIVQDSKEIFRIQPGLWALEEMRDEVLNMFELKVGDKHSEELFTHGYYQGLLVNIGKFHQHLTYIPAQDRNRKFINQRLGDIVDTTELPSFTHKELMKKKKTVDVIWFNEREMPSSFYEVEHTTDIKNSLSKFYELQDFHANFHIVADASRKKEFDDKLHVSMFGAIEDRVKFVDYNRVAKRYEGLTIVNNYIW